MRRRRVIPPLRTCDECGHTWRGYSAGCPRRRRHAKVGETLREFRLRVVEPRRDDPEGPAAA